ncbi:helix-turn-helix transcriptional regulator [Streptomyces sp. SCA3-4]|uniref:winged helix-turn-helix transcriptional regulator n=1 Tax=Streptomyces sichuanensis TaxID=2871810 RepID=UPI001CE2ECA8|nr:helix-turn-helix domain-containing protein [Streptomyces sichuanensis]MCA6096681.1 helix-turn-helix transcriptional regulator [Streptomyces sichuanensis]
MSRKNTCTTEEAAGREVCTVLDVLGRVSGKWSLGVLSETTRGPVRFAELERSLNGISRRILTLTLRQLEANGLLIRTVYPTVPPKVEYTATDEARELYAQLTGLTAWAARHAPATTRADPPSDPLTIART